MSSVWKTVVFQSSSCIASLPSGAEGEGAQRFKDTLKASLKDCHIDPESWEQSAADIPAWRHKVLKGVKSFEKSRIDKIKDPRWRRKEREANVANPAKFSWPDHWMPVNVLLFWPPPLLSCFIQSFLLTLVFWLYDSSCFNWCFTFLPNDVYGHTESWPSSTLTGSSLL